MSRSALPKHSLAFAGVSLRSPSLRDLPSESLRDSAAHAFLRASALSPAGQSRNAEATFQQTPEEPHLGAWYGAIRLAALFKFNTVVIEPWGMFKSERHPWWGWPEAKMTKDEVRRLVAVGRDLGVTLVPQIAAFGHASAASPRASSRSRSAGRTRPSPATG